MHFLQDAKGVFDGFLQEWAVVFPLAFLPAGSAGAGHWLQPSSCLRGPGNLEGNSGHIRIIWEVGMANELGIIIALPDIFTTYHPTFEQLVRVKVKPF